MTKSESEWYNQWQWMTASGTTSDKKWQKMTMNDSEWKRVVQQMKTKESKQHRVTSSFKMKQNDNLFPAEFYSSFFAIYNYYIFSTIYSALLYIVNL